MYEKLEDDFISMKIFDIAYSYTKFQIKIPIKCNLFEIYYIYYK